MAGACKLTVRQLRRSGLWVIVGLPSGYRQWLGPYATRREAEEDRRGVEWFLKIVQREERTVRHDVV